MHSEQLYLELLGQLADEAPAAVDLTDHILVLLDDVVALVFGVLGRGVAERLCTERYTDGKRRSGRDDGTSHDWSERTWRGDGLVMRAVRTRADMHYLPIMPLVIVSARLDGVDVGDVMRLVGSLTETGAVLVVPPPCDPIHAYAMSVLKLAHGTVDALTASAPPDEVWMAALRKLIGAWSAAAPRQGTLSLP